MSARFSSLRQAFESGETLIFGHRGASADAPMNTLAAFELARQDGADGIELDVHASRDGNLVVIHDDTVDATTDGSGFVHQKTLAELKALDAGSAFGAAFQGERIPTLDEVFAEFGADLLINVEIKATLRRAPYIDRMIADQVRKHGLRDRVILSSFDPTTLRRAKEMMPMTLAGFLIQPDMPAEHYLPLKKLWHEARHPRHDMVDAAFHELGRAGRATSSMSGL